MAYLEPHEEIWKNETGQCYSVNECANSQDTFAPFDGLHGFSVGDHEFPGTFFRFPLRNSCRERRVSSHVYDINKLRDLLTALREEAKVMLLFLRSVKTVEVHEISECSPWEISEPHCSDLLKVSVQDMLSDQVSKRVRFNQELKTAFRINSYRIMRPIELTVHIRVTVIDKICRSNSSVSDWLVASRVGSQSTDIHCAAEALRALPWVGVALEITSEPSGGRVFCVLPMPREVSCHLPVHVNATFSLNDERRELKWTGVERKNDNSAKWNSLIIQHLLPPCYAGLLLNHARQYLTGEHFYKAWPDVNQIRYTHWKCVLAPLFQLLFSESVFLSCKGWVHKNKALFTPRDTELPPVVIEVLSACGERMVTIPPEVWDALNLVGVSVVTVTPRKTRSNLRLGSDKYELYPAEKKIELLQYCLSDDAYDDLVDIALLPLANGAVVKFSQYKTPSAVYLCSPQCPSYLAPGCKRKLVDVENNDRLHQQLVCVVQSCSTQLRLLDSSGVAFLLKKSMPTENVVTLPHPKISLEWLKKFWT